MKKTIMIIAMATLIPTTSVWAGDEHKSAVPQSTQKISSDRLDMERERGEMTHKMNEKERGPMLNSTSKKSSDRLQGKREEMTHKMDNNKRGAMSSTTPHERGHRIGRAIEE